MTEVVGVDPATVTGPIPVTAAISPILNSAEIPTSPTNGTQTASPSSSPTLSGAAASLDDVLLLYDDKRKILGIPENEDEQEKIACLNRLLSTAASNGDVVRVNDILSSGRQWLDLDARDEDGTTPLIYAACFGHIDVVYSLLSAGASVNTQDKCRRYFSISFNLV